jgi:hypothetical protein
VSASELALFGEDIYDVEILAVLIQESMRDVATKAGQIYTEWQGLPESARKLRRLQAWFLLQHGVQVQEVRS